MSRLTRVFVSQEDQSAPVTPTDGAGQVLDETHADGDNPVIELHGVTGDESWYSGFREMIDIPDALRVVDGQASFESQQLDESAKADEENKIVEIGELEQKEDNVSGDARKVYVIQGNVDDDVPGNMHNTFSALARAAIDDPTNTVAAFLPIDAGTGEPQAETDLSRSEENMQRVLREQGVPFVSSLEALAEHLNFHLEGKQHFGIALEAAAAKVAKLRAGMRVRYSGGHGKIVKIIDHPTTINGVVHHCTKENPKYEVKAEKGGKLSLHKASALTIV